MCSTGSNQVGRQSAALLASAGTGTVTGNLTGALTDQFGSVAVKIVSLLIFRDDLRARLRETIPSGVPVATEVATMVSAYLAAERDLGRIAAGADIDTLALTLIGTAHLLAVDRESAQPDPERRRRDGGRGSRRRAERPRYRRVAAVKPRPPSVSDMTTTAAINAVNMQSAANPENFRIIQIRREQPGVGVAAAPVILSGTARLG